MAPRLVSWLAAAAAAAFGVFTAAVLVQVGLRGIFEPALSEWGPAQVFADLVIMALITIGWMVRDARERGIAAWPFVLLTLATGSFGPLAYLIARGRRGSAAR
ncbi:abscisic acid-deficient protein Aba4 family protein [Tepidiforma sp.]|uniref:abscisic acid-deficient protein Aba4 family protein n=1 Tax=Tepidiforma sp. TaxID=2682230 RepID=UPI00260F8DD0|nr:abscisic acid-deficient protein Aba4 family protein [Tepidiforma sp.]MCX7618974.1 hypothetical protein [Tepidiforma sp.]